MKLPLLKPLFQNWHIKSPIKKVANKNSLTPLQISHKHSLKNNTALLRVDSFTKQSIQISHIVPPDFSNIELYPGCKSVSIPTKGTLSCSSHIGEGQFATVYKGSLSTGSEEIPVAIKEFNDDTKDTINDFEHEYHTLTYLEKNLTGDNEKFKKYFSLIKCQGTTKDDEARPGQQDIKRVLVTEYIEGKSLDDILTTATEKEALLGQ